MEAKFRGASLYMTIPTTYSHTNPPPIKLNPLKADTPCVNQQSQNKTIGDVTFAEAVNAALKQAGIQKPSDADFSISVKGEKEPNTKTQLIDKYTGHVIEAKDETSKRTGIRSAEAIKVTKTSTGCCIELEIAIKIFKPADKQQTVVIKKPLYTSIKVPEHPTPGEIEAFNQKIQLVILGQRCELREAFCSGSDQEARIQRLINHTISYTDPKTNTASKINASVFELRSGGAQLYLRSLNKTIDITNYISSHRHGGLGQFYSKSRATTVSCKQLTTQLDKQKLLRECFQYERQVLASHSAAALEEKTKLRNDRLKDLAGITTPTTGTPPDITLADACKNVFGNEPAFMKHQQKMLAEVQQHILAEPTQLKSLEQLAATYKDESEALKLKKDQSGLQGTLDALKTKYADLDTKDQQLKREEASLKKERTEKFTKQIQNKTRILNTAIDQQTKLTAQNTTFQKILAEVTAAQPNAKPNYRLTPEQARALFEQQDLGPTAIPIENLNRMCQKKSSDLSRKTKEVDCKRKDLRKLENELQKLEVAHHKKLEEFLDPDLRKAIDDCAKLKSDIEQIEAKLHDIKRDQKNAQEGIAVVNQSRLENEQLLIETVNLLLVVHKNDEGKFLPTSVASAKQLLQQINQYFTQKVDPKDPTKGTYFEEMTKLRNQVETSLAAKQLGTTNEQLQQIESLKKDIEVALQPQSTTP